MSHMGKKSARNYVSIVAVLAVALALVSPMPKASSAEDDAEETYIYSFGEDVLINGSGEPQLFIDNNDVIHIVWRDDLDGEGVYMSKSTDGGQSVTSTVKLFDGWGSVYVDENGFIYCVVLNVSEDNNDLYFIKSMDGGNTFTERVKINDNIRDSRRFHTSIMVDSQWRIYLAWEDDRDDPDGVYLGQPGTQIQDVYFSMSTDGGATFSSNIPVNDDTDELITPGYKRYKLEPEIEISSQGDVFVAWIDTRNEYWEPYLAKLVGESFSENIRIDKESACSRMSMDIGEDDVIYVTFQNMGQDSGADIHFTKSTLGWITFMPSEFVSNGAYPSMAVRNDHIFIAYNLGLSFKFSFDGGEIFSEMNQRVQDHTPYSISPEDMNIIVDSEENVYIAWRQYTENYTLGKTGIEMEIYLDKGIKTLVTPPNETNGPVPPGLTWDDIAPWLTIGAIATVIAVPAVWILIRKM